MNGRDQPADRHGIEPRLAARLAGSLTERALPHDVSERLRFAREGALVRARKARMGMAPTVVGMTGAGAALLSGLSTPWWQRAASVLPLLLLVLGLVVIDRFAVREVNQDTRLYAAAGSDIANVGTNASIGGDIDAQLLADRLPPSAYSDPGFAEFLRTVPPQ